MLQAAANQIGNVRVRERVVDVLPLPPPRDEPVVAQEFEPLRYGRHFLTERARDLRDVRLAGFK